MRRKITNTSCRLYHTAQCDLLNMPSCEECMLSRDEEAADQVMQDMQTLMNLMPEGGISNLFAGDECVLCKGKPNKREYYGLLDMGHAEPKRTKRSVLGLKMKSAVGSLVPVQIGVCNACRKRILRLEYLPVTLPVYLGVAVLLALSIPSVSDMLEKTAAVLPFLIFAVTVGVGVAAGKIISTLLRKRYAELTVLDPFELPTLKEMKDRGWFPLNTNGKRLRLVFVKKRMRMGVGTGTPEEATAE